MEIDWTKCPLVESIADRRNGVPVLRGSRVPAETIVESAELGESPESIAYDYDLSEEEVQALLEYAGRHIPVRQR